MSDSLIRGVIADHTRFIAVDCTELAEQVRQLHELTGDAVKLAAEAVVASVFLAAHIKGEERITLQLQGSKPECAFMCDVDAHGGVRARLTPEVIRMPYHGRMEGMMMVAKSIPGGEPYRGVTEIKAENIQCALTRHLGSSAQVDAILRIGAEVDEDEHVVLAGGVLLERLPASGVPEVEAAAEFAVRFDPIREQAVSSIIAALSAGSLEEAPVQVLEERPLKWRCSCGQERVEAVMASLPVAELQAMLEEDGGAEVICHFCNIAYQINSARLQQLIALGS